MYPERTCGQQSVEKKMYERQLCFKFRGACCKAFTFFSTVNMLPYRSTATRLVSAERRLVRSLTPRLLTRQYHDREVYGYRVAKEFRMPDYTQEELANRVEYGSLLRFVQAYRQHGHKSATLDPLGIMQHEYVS